MAPPTSRGGCPFHDADPARLFTFNREGVDESFAAGDLCREWHAAAGELGLAYAQLVGALAAVARLSGATGGHLGVALGGPRA